MAKSFGKKVFEIIREDGALWDTFPVDIDNANFEFGDAVKADATGKVDKVTAVADGDLFGFAYGDSDQSDVRTSKQVKVYLSNFVARTDKFNTSSTYVPGTKLTVKGGVIDVAGTGELVIGVAKGAPSNGVLEFIVT